MLAKSKKVSILLWKKYYGSCPSLKNTGPRTGVVTHSPSDGCARWLMALVDYI